MPVLRDPIAPTHELPGVSFTSLATPSRGTHTTSVWRVEIAPGTPPTPHQLSHEELFVILSGHANVRLGEERVEAHVGDTIVVPPNTDFALENAGDQPLRALCCFPVGGKARLSDGQEIVPPWSL